MPVIIPTATGDSLAGSIGCWCTVWHVSRCLWHLVAPTLCAAVIPPCLAVKDTASDLALACHARNRGVCAGNEQAQWMGGRDSAVVKALGGESEAPVRLADGVARKGQWQKDAVAVHTACLHCAAHTTGRGGGGGQCGGEQETQTETDRDSDKATQKHSNEQHPEGNTSGCSCSRALGSCHGRWP